MLKTFEAIYENKKLIFKNEKPKVKRAKVYVTVIEEDIRDNKNGIIKYAGCITKRDADNMIKMVNEDCERIEKEEDNGKKSSF